MQLRSRVAVAVAEANGYSSDSTPGQGTSVCRGYGPKKTKKKKVRRISINIEGKRNLKITISNFYHSKDPPVILK